MSQGWRQSLQNSAWWGQYPRCVPISFTLQGWRATIVHMGNAKKSKTLGMPYGTACGRLRKIILFDCIKRLKLNVCFRCGKPIRNVADFSIDHKKPWEGRHARLFWSLKNIAFS